MMFGLLTGDFLLPLLCERAGFPKGTKLLLYEVSAAVFSNLQLIS